MENYKIYSYLLNQILYQSIIISNSNTSNRLLYDCLLKDIIERFNNKIYLNPSLNEYYIPFYIPSTDKIKHNKIPYLIFQTWSSHIVPKDMYFIILENLQKNKNFDYYLFDDLDCEKFISENFDISILQTFKNLIPGAYKADLWRYCILYKYGGIYLDIKFKIITDLKNLIEKHNETIFVKDLYIENQPNNIYQGFIMSEPNLDIYMQTINKINDNTKNNFYGDNVLDPTGPRLFGDIIVKNKLENLIKLDFDYPKIDKDEDGNLIGRHVIKDKRSNILFENYPTYRIEQKNTLKNTNNKYYIDLWLEGKQGELNSNLNKNKFGKFFKGIYKN